MFAEDRYWMWKIDILSAGLKEKSACTNLFMFRSNNVMVRVSRLNFQPRNSKHRSTCDLVAAMDPLPNTC